MDIFILVSEILLFCSIRFKKYILNFFGHNQNHKQFVPKYLLLIKLSIERKKIHAASFPDDESAAEIFITHIQARISLLRVLEDRDST